MVMITRGLLAPIEEALRRQAAVVLLGPRQVGKTTLALEIAEKNPSSLYLDLENIRDRAKLTDAESYFVEHEDKLVILDEIHRTPEIFQTLRGVIDAGRRRGHRTGRFLLLGSASLELLRQSGETLAGRVTYLELAPLGVTEIAPEQLETLWVRGGFPDSFLAATETDSMAWREDMLRTYLERDIPQFGPRVPAETLRRFWTMLAHNQGGLHNAARLASSLDVSGQSVGRYTDLLVDLLLVRRLQPYLTNAGKRLVKSPKLYIRDSGLVHALLNIPDRDTLLGHPVAGGSWEGFVIENLVQASPAHTVSGFYRTSGGAEIDLVLELPGSKRWAIEIKRGIGTKPARGFHEACRDLQPARRLLVHGGSDTYPLGNEIQAVGLRQLAAELSDL